MRSPPAGLTSGGHLAVQGNPGQEAGPGDPVGPWHYKDKSPQATSAATLRQKPRQESSEDPAAEREAERERFAAEYRRADWRSRLPGYSKKNARTQFAPPVLPKHVRACVHSSDKSEQWALFTWLRNNPDELKRSPYYCESWRCPGCAPGEAARLFARIKAGAGRVTENPLEWVFFVLTLDRRGYFTNGKPRWNNVNEAFGELSDLTNRFLKRVGRAYGKVTHTRELKDGTIRIYLSIGRDWVGIVEAHRDGWPHVNFLVHCPKLAALLAAEKVMRLADPELADAVEHCRAAFKARKLPSKDMREKARRAVLMGSGVLEHAIGAGWGKQSTAEVPDSIEALAGYFSKLAKHQDATIGELAKLTQAPYMAPGRFRRVRSGKGFLPPRLKPSGERTGVMVRKRRSPEGDWETLAVNPAKDPQQQLMIDRALAAELAVIRREEERLSAAAKLAKPPAPVERDTLQDSLERLWAAQVRALQGKPWRKPTTDFEGPEPPTAA